MLQSYGGVASDNHGRDSARLTKKIDELRFVQGESAVDISDEITRLQKKKHRFDQIDFQQAHACAGVASVASPSAPPTHWTTSKPFSPILKELHGDRHFADDYAIVGGLARFNGQSVMVIGHQKGRDTKEKIRRNLACRALKATAKALRLMQTALKNSACRL